MRIMFMGTPEISAVCLSELIASGNEIVAVVTGKDKANILKQSFFGPVTPEVPASILQFHPDVTLIADEAACSLL